MVVVTGVLVVVAGIVVVAAGEVVVVPEVVGVVNAAGLVLVFGMVSVVVVAKVIVAVVVFSDFMVVSNLMVLSVMLFVLCGVLREMKMEGLVMMTVVLALVVAVRAVLVGVERGKLSVEAVAVDVVLVVFLGRARAILAALAALKVPTVALNGTW